MSTLIGGGCTSGWLMVPGVGHLDLEAGFGPWPAVARWARDDVQAIAATNDE